jgi:hypothetical protein
VSGGYVGGCVYRVVYLWLLVVLKLHYRVLLLLLPSATPEAPAAPAAL